MLRLSTEQYYVSVNSKRNGFIIASGSTNHMVNDESLLRNTEPCQLKVQTAKNEVLQCQVKGEAVLSNHNGERVLH
jgi:hypothetical protein